VSVLPIDSVFHPTDLSAASEVAFVHALRIALAAQSEITLLNAKEKTDGKTDWKAFPGIRDTLEAWGLLPEDSPARAVRKLGIRPEKLSAHGLDPVEAILDHLSREPASLIVLATEGREGISRLFNPSVAEIAARKSEAMTLFVPFGERTFVDRETGKVTLQNVVIPVAKDPRPEAAMQAAARLAEALGATGVNFTLLHVGNPRSLPVLRPPHTQAGTWETLTRDGDVVDEILEVAAGHAADLILMTTRGRQGFLDALRGTTTERVLRAAPCPLLSIPDED
jgi:nucleotide-binding universal stress UspA family protein